MSLRIKVPHYDLPVRRVTPVLLHVDDLLPHEEIVTERLLLVKEMLLRTGVVDMPIITTKIPGSSKYLIVDGHHRWAALKELKFRLIPSIIIDYFDPSVKVFTWYPGVDVGINNLRKVLRELNLDLDICEWTVKEIPRDVLRNSAFVVVGDNGCLRVRGSLTEQKIILKELDALNVKGKLSLTWYGLLEDAVKDLTNGSIRALLVRRALTKREIMNIVRRGGVLPPKTTRHVLPYIPAKTDTPLNVLK